MEIQRALENILDQYLVAGKVNVLYGARRVGKTFLLKKIVHKSQDTYLWLNGELPETQALLAEKNIAHYQRLFAGKNLLVIDEAQEIPEIGSILKIIVDEFSSLKIIASGSSSFDLTNQLGEPLVGRAYWHEMFPLAQMELKNHESLIETRRLLEERLIYGSYPEVYTLPTYAEKERYLRELIQAYLLKDILRFEGIRNASKIFDLLKMIAYQLGKEVSLLELGKQLQMSKNTVEKYLDLLEKVYVLKKIGGFSRNLRKEITKSARWYFWDNGIRNAVIGDFRHITNRNDVGDLWENYVLTERLKKNRYEGNFTETYFWRTYDQQEIDCVEVENQEIRAFEFKWGIKTPKKPTAFGNAYPDASFEVISPHNYWAFVE